MWAQIVQSKWKTLKHSDGAALAWEQMTLPHPVTLSRQNGPYRQGGGKGQTRGTQGQGFTRAVKVGFTTLCDTCCKNEINLRPGFWGQTLNEKRNILLLKHLQTQQDQQGNVVHASLHPLLQRHGAAAVSIDCCHHVLQNLMKRQMTVTTNQHEHFYCLKKAKSRVWEFVDLTGARKLIISPTLANECCHILYVLMQAISWANTCVFIHVFEQLFFSEWSILGLTGLSSDTSHPRYSAACIIWAIILSTSCFKRDKRLFSSVTDTIKHFKLNSDQMVLKLELNKQDPPLSQNFTFFVLTITPKIFSQQLTELSRTPLPSLSYSLKATKERGEMKGEVLEQVITHINPGLVETVDSHSSLSLGWPSSSREK